MTGVATGVTASWTALSGATTTTLHDLPAGTYYWQVRATTTGGTTYADASHWWSFSVRAGEGFRKTAVGSGSIVMADDVALAWSAVTGDPSYSVCWDTTDNDTCDTSWSPNGGSTARTLEGLSAGTYYWQARVWDGSAYTEADGDIWWTFVKVTGESGKLLPKTGVSGLDANLWLSWAAAGDVAYYVCWDTTDNNACDTSWAPNGGSTTKLLEGLSAGTYYWQVKTWDGSSYTELNGGVWWHFTVGADPGPGSGTKTVTREYIYLGSKLLASVESGTTTTYYHVDVLGSVRAITSAPESAVTRHDFAAFGENASSLSGDPRKFIGGEQDAETAFDYLGARYYRNVWGRFTSPDDSAYMNPLDPQTFNAYAYVMNNPLRWVDPTGHSADDPPHFKVKTVCTDDPACAAALQRAEDAQASALDFFLESERRFKRQSVLNSIQTALDGASMGLDATGIGAAVSWVPDLVNGVISLGRGDWSGAGLSAAAMVPFLGNVSNAARLAKVAAKESRVVFKTTREAAAAARELGFRRINELSNGQAIFTDGRRFITRDIDGHSGGAWKLADSINGLFSATTRLGTYSADLRTRIGR